MLSYLDAFGNLYAFPSLPLDQVVRVTPAELGGFTLKPIAKALLGTLPIYRHQRLIREFAQVIGPFLYGVVAERRVAPSIASRG
jgi:hypothetical protein